MLVSLVLSFFLLRYLYTKFLIPMDMFEKIEQNRTSHGYLRRSFVEYKRFCNRTANKQKDSDTTTFLMCKLESNLAKFHIFSSLRFLHKNLRLLRKNSEILGGEFSSAYGFYTQCFIESRKGEVPLQKLLELRSTLGRFYTFTNDIYLMDDGRHDFSQYKVKTKWNDIEIVFESQNMCDAFLSGSFTQSDNRFNTQLALLITNYERARREFLDDIGKVSLVQILFRHKKMHSTLQTLHNFLEENFVTSNYVGQALGSTHAIYGYLSSTMAYRSGDIEAKCDDKPFSSNLPGFESDIERLRELKAYRVISRTKLRQLLMDEIEKVFSVAEDNRPMPLLPVFYDLSYDYIKYPTEESKILGFFKRLSFIKK